MRGQNYNLHKTLDKQNRYKNHASKSVSKTNSFNAQSDIASLRGGGVQLNIYTDKMKSVSHLSQTVFLKM